MEKSIAALSIEDIEGDDEANYENLEVWEDLHFEAIAWDELKKKGSLTDEEKAKILDTYGEEFVEEMGYEDLWCTNRMSELSEENRKKEYKQFLKEHPEEAKMVLDDSWVTDIVERTKKKFDIFEKERAKFVGREDVLAKYKEVQDKYDDDDPRYWFLELCISNGGGDPDGLEEMMENDESILNTDWKRRYEDKMKSEK